MKKFSFPPIVDSNSKILILGTMPGEKSLKDQQYYANPQNQFWEIISYVTGENFITSYEDKSKLLLKNYIAIWDVLMHCEREGSLDANISDEVPKDFKTFFEQYPNIKFIYFNGGKASELFCTYVEKNQSIECCTLPSTSSANRSMTLDKKKEIWKTKIANVL